MLENNKYYLQRKQEESGIRSARTWGAGVRLLVFNSMPE